MPLSSVRTCLATAVFCLGLALPGAAQTIDLPGVSNDSEQFAAGLSRWFVAGASAATRSQTERRAAAAAARNDWTAAANALEERLGQGQGSADL